MKHPIRFSGTGPAGWAEQPDINLETAELITEPPTGLDHIYYHNDERQVRSGIWRASAYTEWYEDYPCDEFMYVLEGSVTLENDDFCETYSKGDAFLVPKGFRGYWKQTEPMLKYYVMIG